MIVSAFEAGVTVGPLIVSVTAGLRVTILFDRGIASEAWVESIALALAEL